MATLTQPGVLLPASSSEQPRWLIGYIWTPAEGMLRTEAGKVFPATVSYVPKYYWS